MADFDLYKELKGLVDKKKAGKGGKFEEITWEEITPILEASRGKNKVPTKLSEEEVKELLKDLEDNFYTYNVANRASQEDIKIPDTVKTQDQLVGYLVDKYSGAAFGDMHTQTEGSDSINKNMDTFGTLYVEAGMLRELFDSVKDLSVEEIDQVLDGKEVKDVNLPDTDSPMRAFTYMTLNTEGYIRAVVENIRDAKAGKKDIVFLDGEYIQDYTDPPLSEGISLDQLRVPLTNFEWVHNIKEDRKDKDDDFGLFHGGAHSGNTIDGSRGMVAQALGVPHVAFTNSKTEDNGFHKGAEESGIDFWLHGGPDFEATPIFMGFSGGKSIVPERDFFKGGEKTYIGEDHPEEPSVYEQIAEALREKSEKEEKKKDAQAEDAREQEKDSSSIDPIDPLNLPGGNNSLQR